MSIINDRNAIGVVSRYLSLQDSKKNIINDNDYIKWRYFHAICTTRYLMFFFSFIYYDDEFQIRIEDAPRLNAKIS